MQATYFRLSRISPVWFAFLASLLLSLIAVLGVVTVGKDAAFYLDIAKQASEQGVGVAQERFNWPWFVLLLAGSHKYLGLPLELAGYLWCALFMAGTCALLVDVVRRRVPEAAWWACLVVLAMPAFNQFRNDILREFGFWFFSVLTLWLALRWQHGGGWLRLLLIFPAALGAALFRLEAVLLLPALALWQLPALFDSVRRKRALQLYLLLALLAVAAGLGLYALIRFYDFPVSRLNYYFSLLDPRHLINSLDSFAGRLADSMTYKFSRDDAGMIVLCGLFVTLLIKFLQLLGPFALILLDRHCWLRLPAVVRAFSLFGWAFLLYLLVLYTFFIHEQFTTTRYLSLLNILAVPAVAVLFSQLSSRWPRLVRAFVVLALLVMLANVVSLSAKKTHLVEAGHWLSEHVEADANIYYEDLRIGYYAGFGYQLERAVPRPAALAAPEPYAYLLIEADGDEPWLLEWLEQHDRRVLARFANRKDDAVLVIGR